MCKKIGLTVLLILCMAFVLAPKVEAVQSSGSCSIIKSTGDIANPLQKVGNNKVTLTVRIQNTSTEDDGVTAVPAILCGSVIEIDACKESSCATEIPGTLELDTTAPGGGCEILNTGVKECKIDPLNSNKVIITMQDCNLSSCPNFTGGVALPANTNIIPLVKIYKKTLNPVKTPSSGQFYARSATELDNLYAYSTANNECAGGEAGSSTPLFFPGVKNVAVEKSCTDGAWPNTPIHISGTICNKGDFDLNISKLENILNPGPGQTVQDITASIGTPPIFLAGGGDYDCICGVDCTSSISYEADEPFAVGVTTDKVVVTGTWEDQTEAVGTSPTKSCQVPPPNEDFTVSKSCENGKFPNDPITISGVIENTGDADVIITKIENIVKKNGGSPSTIDISAVCGLSLPLTLTPKGTPNASATYNYTYPSVEIGDFEDYVKVTGTLTFSQQSVTRESPPKICQVPEPAKDWLVTKACLDGTFVPQKPVHITGDITNAVTSEISLQITKIENIVSKDGGAPSTIDISAVCGLSLPLTLNPGGKATYNNDYPFAVGEFADQVRVTVKWLDGTQDTKTSQLVNCEVPPPKEDFNVTKSCTDGKMPDTPITISGVIENTGEADVIITKIVNIVSKDNGPPSTIDISNDCGLTLPLKLTPQGTLTSKATYNYTYKTPVEPGNYVDYVKVTGTLTFGQQSVTRESTPVPCDVTPCPPIGLEVVKTCKDAADCNGSITFDVTITNTGETNLIKFDITEESKEVAPPGAAAVQAIGDPVVLDWDSAMPGIQTLAEVTADLQLAPDASATFSAIYTTGAASVTTLSSTVAAVEPGGCIQNTVTVKAYDDCDQDITKSSTATCCIPKCPSNEICRTPGYWGTHVGNLVALGEKGYKEGAYNVTQCVINRAIANGAPGLQVCGQTIDNTNIGDIDSAIEAICVAVKGQPIRQLARQLTAASLNCVMSKGNQDCSEVSIDAVFDECNTLCASGSTDQKAITNCIDKIDCFNNGGNWEKAPLTLWGMVMPLLETWQCVIREDNCHERELCNEEQGLCFEPSPPAVSDTCQAANGNPCTVVGSNYKRGNLIMGPGKCDADGTPASVDCPKCEDTKCSE